MSKLIPSLDVVAEQISFNFSKLRRVRRGNKLSRALRPIMAHKKIKQVVGTNLAILTLMSSTLPQIKAADEVVETTVVIEIRDSGRPVNPLTILPY